MPILIKLSSSGVDLLSLRVNTIDCIQRSQRISNGKYRRVQLQLRLVDGLLTKSDRPVILPTLRTLIVAEMYNIAHFGTDKVYQLLKDRCYWPTMYNYIKIFSQGCETCQKTTCDSSPPKAPLAPMYIPHAPMQFVSIDIAYLPKYHQGYHYILLIGDVFSKFISVVPLKQGFPMGSRWTTRGLQRDVRGST